MKPAATRTGYAPRLLGEAEAARYLGISPSTIRMLPLRRRALGRRRLFDRLDLDAFADAIPYEDEANSCDAAF